MIPVELYINGDYRGSYNFTEKVGFAGNSIDLDDETDAVLIELDSYYDETYKFHSNPYHLPVNIKEPDFSEGKTQLTLDDIKGDFNRVMQVLKDGGEIAELVDLDYLARYLLVNELIENYELMHPKSTYLYKERVKGGSKYIFGPVWDLDWAYGYELNQHGVQRVYARPALRQSAARQDLLQSVDALYAAGVRRAHRFLQ